jgi:phosphocarrier protein
MLDMGKTLTGAAELTNAVGLHARPSVKLTQLAKRFQSTVEFAIKADGPWVDAKSPVKVMRAKAPKRTGLHIATKGPDAEAALAAVVALIKDKFGEE